MLTKTLYRYNNGRGTSVSPKEPKCEYNTLIRLVADDGKRITRDGQKLYRVIDVKSADGWYEVDEPK